MIFQHCQPESHKLLQFLKTSIFYVFHKKGGKIKQSQINTTEPSVICNKYVIKTFVVPPIILVKKI